MNIDEEIKIKIKDIIAKKLKEVGFVSKGKVVDKKRISEISLIEPLEIDDSNVIHFKGTCEYTAIGEVSGCKRFEGTAILKELQWKNSDINVEIEFQDKAILNL